MNQLIIKGYKYEVLKEKPSKVDGRTEYYLAKPKGQVVYWAIKNKYGVICDPVSMSAFGGTREHFAKVANQL